MSSKNLSFEQQRFHQFCMNDELDSAKEMLATGAVLDGLALGLAGGFPQTHQVFDWLLENNCEVNGDTWLYIVGNENSIFLTKKIAEKGHDLHGAAIFAALEPNQTLLQYVTERVGWKSEYLTFIAQGTGNKSEQTELFKWGVETSGIVPDKNTVEAAEKHGNVEIIQYISNSNHF